MARFPKHIDPSPVPHRDMCYRCVKPRATCLCNDITKVDNTTSVHIVQHVRERRHPIGTARIAALGLSRVAVDTVYPITGRFSFDHPLPPRAALLYPSPDAVLMEQLTERERPHHLVVIDGTWHQAAQIYRDSPALQTLPRLTFGTVQPSNYRIRKEPNDSANATIEAICRALRILEPQTPGIDGLLSTFDRMIETQLRYSKRGNPRRVMRVKQKRSKAIPRCLVDPKLFPVIACGESAPMALPPKKRYLVAWNALRLSDGQTFQATIEPPHFLSVQEREHMQLTDDRLSNTISREAFREQWRGFLRPEDVLITWNKQPMGRLFDMAGPHSRFLFLKAVFGNLHRDIKGNLSHLVEREKIVYTPCAAPEFTERAANRLGQIAAMLAHITRGARGGH